MVIGIKIVNLSTLMFKKLLSHSSLLVVFVFLFFVFFGGGQGKEEEEEGKDMCFGLDADPIVNCCYYHWILFHLGQLNVETVLLVQSHLAGRTDWNCFWLIQPK